MLFLIKYGDSGNDLYIQIIIIKRYVEIVSKFEKKKACILAQIIKLLWKKLSVF